MTYRLLALLATTLLSSVAFANDDDKTTRGGDTFKSMDRNSDDRLSQNEVSNDQRLAQRFAALDRDSDGYLTKREYSEHMKDNNRNKEGRQY